MIKVQLTFKGTVDTYATNTIYKEKNNIKTKIFICIDQLFNLS